MTRPRHDQPRVIPAPADPHAAALRIADAVAGAWHHHHGSGDLATPISTVAALTLLAPRDPAEHTQAAGWLLALTPGQLAGLIRAQWAVLVRARPDLTTPAWPLLKVYKVLWEAIPQLARLRSEYQAPLEDGAEEALGAAYTQRWDRFWQHNPHGQPAVTTTASPAGADGAARSKERPDWMDRPGGLLEVVPATPPWRQREQAEQTGTPPDDDRQVDRTFAELIADVPRVPPILIAVDTVMADHGNPERLHTKIILRAIGDPTLSDKKLGLLLDPLGIHSINPWDEGGHRGRGYLRAEVTTALDAIRTGELTPPASVYDWTPDA